MPHSVVVATGMDGDISSIVRFPGAVLKGTESKADEQRPWLSNGEAFHKNSWTAILAGKDEELEDIFVQVGCINLRWDEYFSRTSCSSLFCKGSEYAGASCGNKRFNYRCVG